MFRWLALLFAMATPVSAQVTYGPLVDFTTRAVITDPDNPVIVFVRDMRPEISRVVICPAAETVVAVRGALMGGDLSRLQAAAQGHGCFLSADARGDVIAVHLQRVVQVRFTWLLGEDFDTGAPARLENSGREYWVMSSQLGILPGNGRVEPIIDAAFQ